MKKARLREQYDTTIRPELAQRLGFANILAVPRIAKVVINIGAKEAVADSRILQPMMQTVATITGQMPVKRLARKSIAGFKIREGMPLGVMVTLRGNAMFVFLDKLINLALPKVRDFQGIPTKFDGRGNYNLGIKEVSIFPEAETTGAVDKTFGCNITITTTAKNDDHARELLRGFGMPFKK